MIEEWFQLWVDIPIVGRQWGGWLRATRIVAQGLSETFATSAAQAAGFRWTILDVNGQAINPVIPGLTLPTLPGLKL